EERNGVSIGKTAPRNIFCTDQHVWHVELVLVQGAIRFRIESRCQGGYRLLFPLASYCIVHAILDNCLHQAVNRYPAFCRVAAEEGVVQERNQRLVERL